MAPHPLARRTREPRPLVQAGQIGPAPLAGAIKTLAPGRQIVSQDSPDGVSRIGGQAGTQAPDPTPVPGQNRGSRAGSTIHSLPAEYLRLFALKRQRCLEHRSARFGALEPAIVPGVLKCRRRQERRVRRAWGLPP